MKKIEMPNLPDYSQELRSFRAFNRNYPDRLLYYVYALIDPRDHTVFYIGKGKKERLFNHVQEACRLSSQNITLTEKNYGQKLERIIDIHNSNNKVEMYILHYGLTEEHALLAESILIDVFQKFNAIDTTAINELTNSISGFDCKHGFTSITDLGNNLTKEEVEVLCNEKLLVIKISGKETSENEIYERVRKYWRLNPKKADKATYIAACRNGIVVGLFKNNSGWKKIQNPVNNYDVGRFYFEGESVKEDNIRARFIGKVIKYPRGAQNPILYYKNWT